MKRILIIPHTTEFSVRQRLREIGGALSRYYRVYFLLWSEPATGRFLDKAAASLKDIFRRPGQYEKDGLFFARIPLWHRPLCMIKSYNARSLEKFLITHDIDIVINGTHYFFVTPSVKKHRYKHIFDLNDLPTEETRSPLGRFIHEFTKREIEKADIVTACSRGLVDYVKGHFGRTARFLPNGTYLGEFKNCDTNAAIKIRRKYNLSDKFIIGYIGHVGEWIDLEFLVKVFRAVKAGSPDTALMIVGGGQKMEHYRRLLQEKDIVFTGGIPRSEITPYFFAINAGVMPGKKNLFQDVAFHIKLIEYTAARKMVISSPLKEVEQLGFPNVFIESMNVEAWARLINKIRSRQWDPSWDNLVTDYDWEKIGESFREIIERF
jgi:glycosyltransferase involved in cell wall biosynthesis